MLFILSANNLHMVREISVPVVSKTDTPEHQTLLLSLEVRDEIHRKSQKHHREHDLSNSSLPRKGNVVLIVNKVAHIPGIQTDIEVLENFYTNKSYRVTGGWNDPELIDKRNINTEDMVGLLKKFDHLYRPATQLARTEYDRVIVHIFAPGNDEYICVPNEYERKTQIVDSLAAEMSHFARQTAVVIFIHSSEPLPCSFTTQHTHPPDYTEVPWSNSRNMLGFYTHQAPMPGYDANDRGSWIVQKFVQQMERSACDVREVAQRVNAEALCIGHPSIQIEEIGFKKLVL